MRATSSLPDDKGNGSVVTTARHMADAVGYLTRVATNAGLRGVAGKLTNVRASLLRVVAGGSEDDGSAKIEDVSGSQSQINGDERHDGRKVS